MVEAQLEALGLSLPAPFVYPQAMTGAKRSGQYLYVSGTVPATAGVVHYQGRLGAECSVEDGYAAARICVLNSLALIKQALGDLERVAQILKVNVYVSSTPEFARQPEVANGASDLLYSLFGERGVHARTAVGVAGLPMQVPVELEMVIEIVEEGEQ